jgi:hypothetical protein
MKEFKAMWEIVDDKVAGTVFPHGTDRSIRGSHLEHRSRHPRTKPPA